MWRILRPRRRETLIALRATKTAHGMARDMLNPHLNLPEYQREVMPARDVLKPIDFEYDPKPLVGPYMRAFILAILLLMVCYAFAYFFFMLCGFLM
jgi:hypothetical protein